VQRLEILDWYHLMENLGKVGGSQQRLDAVESCLWRGDVEAAVRQFEGWSHERVDRLIAYLAKHRHRIVNYAYHHAEGISVGWARSSQPSNQLGGESTFQELSGPQTRCNKSCDNDARI
jgi:hypothetical protein